MPNGIEIKIDEFKTLDSDKRSEVIFENVYAIKQYIFEQPPKCQEMMADKIKTNNKIHRRINFGIGSGGGIGVVAVFELVRQWWTGG